jgi:hypothetical protein
MRAIFFIGGKVDVYILEEKPEQEPEVKDFIDSNLYNKSNSGYVKGFMRLINLISEKGYIGVNSEQFDCWEEGGGEFCELIRGPFRIGCFRNDDKKKLVLATVFRKYKMKEKKQYKRVVNLKNAFNKNPVWEKSNE